MPKHRKNDNSEKNKPVSGSEKNKPVSSSDKTKPVLNAEKTKPLSSSEKNKPVVKSEKDKALSNSVSKGSSSDDTSLKSIPVLQSIIGKSLNGIEVTAVENNTSASTTSKKKKKKKKKAQSDSTTTPETAPVDDTEMPKLPFSEDLEKLLKRSEISVTVAPQQNEIIKQEAQQPNVPCDNGVESTATKKKKKKKKKKNSVNEGEQGDTVDAASKPDAVASRIPDGVIPTISQSMSSSYLKIPTQSSDSVLLVVNPFEQVKAEDANKNGGRSISATIVPQPINSLGQVSEQVPLNSFPLKSDPAVSISKLPLEEKQENCGPVTQVNENNWPTNTAQNCSENAVTEGNPGAQKTKSQLKAERRALQEAQRAAKAASKQPPANEAQPQNKAATPPKPTVIVKHSTDLKPAKETRKISFYSHLPQFKSSTMLKKHLESDNFIHPAVTALGALCAKNSTMDSNALSVEILTALKNVVEDYSTPPNKELCRDLGSRIESHVSFIAKCRPLSVGTLCALKVLKLSISKIPIDQSDVKAKESICETIEKFIKDSIYLAAEAISKSIASQIKDGDIILTYGYSSVVSNAFFAAQEQNKVFKVVIIDSRPELEGRVMLRNLLQHGISCSYSWIHALTFVMKEVTKVVIGAYAVRASGYVMSRIGTSQIALLASSLNIPFIVSCEAYKFCDRALIDSFIDNELGDPDSLVKTPDAKSPVLENYKEIGHLELLNPLYDATPPHLVSKLITEKCHCE